MNTSAIVAKVWSYCNALRDDGVGYGDYLEQLSIESGESFIEP
jgi:type I restriction enzyme M protein